MMGQDEERKNRVYIAVFPKLQYCFYNRPTEETNQKNKHDLGRQQVVLKKRRQQAVCLWPESR